MFLSDKTLILNLRQIIWYLLFLYVNLRISITKRFFNI